jgi:DNA-binding NtrC family response regulator
MVDERHLVFIVDDDAGFLKTLSALMSKRYDVESARSVDEALKVFQGSAFDVVLLDLNLGKRVDGLELLDKFRAIDPAVPVIMVTDDNSPASIVAALKKGAADYINKCPNMADLECRILKAIGDQHLSRVNRALRDEVDEIRGEMVGESPPMLELRRRIDHAARTMMPVLIHGETGTGKEVVAREIHRRFSPNSSFLGFNSTEVSKDLFESKLFGSERGAFTGAVQTVTGLFERAGDGVLFLDEITEIDASLQAKLLRVIEQREFERLGSSRRMRFRGKVLASTNRNLQEAVDKGAFRKDLYFRFSTHLITVPPLRERRGDIPLLARYFLRRKSRELGLPMPSVGDDEISKLCSEDWPGNVRELENRMIGWVIDDIGASAPGREAGSARNADGDLFEMDYLSAKRSMVQRFQRAYLARVLASCNGDVNEAAKRMNISRQGLQKIMKEIGD